MLEAVCIRKGENLMRTLYKPLTGKYILKQGYEWRVPFVPSSDSDERLKIGLGQSAYGWIVLMVQLPRGKITISAESMVEIRSMLGLPTLPKVGQLVVSNTAYRKEYQACLARGLWLPTQVVHDRLEGWSGSIPVSFTPA